MTERPTARTPIYLDYQATTPVDQRVVEAMRPYFEGRFGNPHSSTHRYGWEAEAGVERARRQVADLIGAAAHEITFTSGATEANNLVIKGVADALGPTKNHMITAATEHKCVLESLRTVEARGWRVDVLPVDADGLIDLEQLAGLLTPRTALVSIMAVNNEIGTIQPLAEIGALCRAAGVLFHTDAAQAFGKVALDVTAQSVDFLSLSGHKIYGPKGIGALYKRRAPEVVVTPQMSGGGQEHGLRSGTVAAPLAVGLGAAAAIAAADGDADEARIAALAERFLAHVRADLGGVRLNGGWARRYRGNLNLSFPGLDGDLLLARLRGLAVSSGAACASAAEGSSYVLRAIGLDEAAIRASLRIGFGRFTTADEVDRAAQTLVRTVHSLGGLDTAVPAAV
ncbi:cysteine desulfurase IscS [Rhodothalassium salexigens DSM 2132]|uniref:Cysteine desulfurase n=1 Tax=Rhodothalassium salexigens DSM 2132 TaxID=1188247 RepID=A0A4R2PTE9_RHOSA|nr:aminotransferase class V-fold PLP-dependent enzyme [Rhodothalassium salexigens]MBB4210240.1 cysteine desulfurase [Rhodothalassium salexigens DSM 2132]MBK1638680.1 IscS subfamily cysteine desulfurase [Rhodothalassium salexigens DSM 2132]TCP38404.1 cysteine desulfurase IscS [Rhodothalassium salexigens DSM 2132]